jgi:iron complex transport system substrate-binding protein
MASTLRGADVLIWTTESDAEQAALLADPVIAALPAKRHVFTGKELAGAIAFASPLSYPFVADALPPLLSRALR